jgi:hypothetical protein
MNDRAKTVLTLLVNQFERRHGLLPQQIVLTPLALLALAIKGSVAPTWLSVPVTCREINESEATDDIALGKLLGVFVLPEERTGRIVACDLKHE